mmetsp:Transcript_122868/g.281802  ORF Transcript_122868/g.281802 Transcript_122868/m.281802 type:complete len:280 (+) Transcript_122868:785-1624(+)
MPRPLFFNSVADALKIKRREFDADPESNSDGFKLLLTDTKADGTPFFTDSLRVATMQGFLNGAFDTTHCSISWVTYFLAKHPETQQRLRDELYRKYGTKLQGETKDCPLTPADLSQTNFPMLEAVIRESLRLLSTVPVVQRMHQTETFDVPGLAPDGGEARVDPGVSCNIVYALAFHEESYAGKNPKEFDIDRWLQGHGNNKTFAPPEDQINKHFFAFGGHARICVGMNFAYAELRSMLAYMVATFSWTLENPNEQVDALYEAGVQQPKTHFKINFKKL